MSGCSSGVEHNLAKVGVERSNRFTRSIFLPITMTTVFATPAETLHCRAVWPRPEGRFPQLFEKT